MRQFRYLIAVLSMTVLLFGCDSNDPETPEDMLVGSWTPYVITDEDGNKTNAFLSDADEFTFRFRSNRSFTIFLDFNASGEAKGYLDVGHDGTFSMDEAPIRWLYLDFSSSDTTLQVNYNFNGENFFLFSGQADELHALIGGLPMSGVFEMGLQRE